MHARLKVTSAQCVLLSTSSWLRLQQSLLLFVLLLLLSLVLSPLRRVLNLPLQPKLIPALLVLLQWQLLPRFKWRVHLDPIHLLWPRTLVVCLVLEHQHQLQVHTVPLHLLVPTVLHLVAGLSATAGIRIVHPLLLHLPLSVNNHLSLLQPVWAVCVLHV